MRCLPSFVCCGLGAILLISSGCDHDATAPERFDIDHAPVIQAASPPAVSLTDFLTLWLPTLPPEAQSVWNECVRRGSVGVAGTRFSAGVNCRLLDKDGYPRRYVVYVPSSVANAVAPVVFMFHGSSGSGEQFLDISGWREQADESGFVAVFPTGLTYLVLDEGRTNTKWNEYDLAGLVDLNVRPRGYPTRSPFPADDVGFVRGMIDDLEQTGRVDPARIYVSGFSNGGSFALRLAVDLSDRLAAVGAFAGNLREEKVPLVRLPVALGFGTLDDRILGEINATRPPGQDSIVELPLDPALLFAFSNIQEVREAVTATFDLAPEVFEIGSGPHSSTFTWTTPLPGNWSGNVLAFGFLEDVTHQYPRGTGRRRGPNNPYEFDAARRFWQFFANHPRR